MATQQLAIIGLGPKGAAIAAKATALKTKRARRSRYHRLRSRWRRACLVRQIRLYRRRARALHIGRARYRVSGTTGLHRMKCSRNSRGNRSRFRRSSGGAKYDEWVTRGRRPPLHRQFARYLEFVVRRCLLNRVHEEVTQIEFDHDTKRWIVFTKTGPHPLLFDGVVITGSGKPYRALPNANQRVFNGRTFWQNLLGQSVGGYSMRARWTLRIDPF